MEGTKDPKSCIQRAMETQGAFMLGIRNLELTLSLKFLTFRILCYITENQEPQL